MVSSRPTGATPEHTHTQRLASTHVRLHARALQPHAVAGRASGLACGMATGQRGAKHHTQLTATQYCGIWPCQAGGMAPTTSTASSLAWSRFMSLLDQRRKEEFLATWQGMLGSMHVCWTYIQIQSVFCHQLVPWHAIRGSPAVPAQTRMHPRAGRLKAPGRKAGATLETHVLLPLHVTQTGLRGSVGAKNWQLHAHDDAKSGLPITRAHKHNAPFPPSTIPHTPTSSIARASSSDKH